MTHRFSYAILRVFAALVVFLLLAFYVWCAQRVYDTAGQGLARIALYALLVLGAGLSYDCGKAILLMPRSHLKERVLMPMALLSIMVVTGAATVFFAFLAWPMSAMLVYVGGLSYALFGFNHGESSLGSAASADIGS